MTFLRDLAYASRTLSRTPALTAALLATVAIGIGTHAALVGFTSGLVAGDLAGPEAQSVVTMRSGVEGEPVAAPPPAAPLSGADLELQAKMAGVRRMLWWRAGLVFLTAAPSVAGFLLSRAWRRSHETAARVALGATARHLASQMLADSLLISLLGGALGGLAGFWTAGAFPALLFAEDAARLHFVAPAAETARSVAGYSVVMILCALAPMLRIRHDGVLSILRRGGSGQV